ncbi:hypothetical protein AFLA70_51g004421 [Aspergillus flavus AF70]|nr:hypothetical protein AFLA70_51g004421 [Aspergillus flavus AF70]
MSPCSCNCCSGNCASCSCSSCSPELLISTALALRSDTQCATEHLSYSRLDFFPASDFRFDLAVAKICSNEYWV